MQLVRLEMEKKLKQLQDRLHDTEESECSFQEQMIFLSTWDPVVMSPGYTDITLQSGGHIVDAHRAVLVMMPFNLSFLSCFDSRSVYCMLVPMLSILKSHDFTIFCTNILSNIPILAQFFACKGQYRYQKNLTSYH